MVKIYGSTTTTPFVPNGESGGGTGVVDQTYTPTSSNAQSGKAVAEAIEDKSYVDIADFYSGLYSILHGSEVNGMYTLTFMSTVDGYIAVQFEPIDRENQNRNFTFQLLNTDVSFINRYKKFIGYRHLIELAPDDKYVHIFTYKDGAYKQDKLIAGDGITIEGNVISAENNENTVNYTDTKTLKVEENVITDDSIVTLGQGWSGNIASGFTHTSGNAEPLSFAVGAEDGESYIIEADWNGSDAERCITLKLGSEDNLESIYATDPYGNGDKIQWGLKCVGNNGILQIVPTNAYKGTISNLRCRKVSNNGTDEVTITLDEVGYGKLAKHLTGFWNTYIGKEVLKNSINTTRCIGIGTRSLQSLKTGGRNIGIGTYSLPSMEYGENVISIGADSGFEVKEAHDCVIIGKGALSYGSKRVGDIAIGQSALYNVEKGETENNIGIGAYSGYYCKSKENIFIGKRAGYYLTTGTSNLIIGSNAGEKFKTGWANVAIGAGAGASGDFSQVVAIGYNAQATKSKQVVLGGDHIVETLLKGDLVIRGTDGTKRKLVFNADNTISWVTV
jgi:hypothetical protein